MKKTGLWTLTALLLLFVGYGVYAQDSTAEATVETTLEAAATAEATPELPPGALNGFPGAGSYTVQQPYADVQRSYHVYIPASYDAEGEPVALVIVLHGAGGTGAGTESFTGFDALADTEDFVVVYPNGINNAWNDNRNDPRVSSIDDVRFISDIVTYVSGQLNIDPARVYATGYSMGGMMSYRLGCERSDLFAAVGSVASTMPVYLIDTCLNTPPIPVIVFQGTDDPVVPWTGIAENYLSAAQTLGFWGYHNQCANDFAVESLPNGDPEDYTQVMRQQLTGCAADMVLYGIYFGGHTWPAHPISTTIQLGATSYDVDATDQLWAFFKAHPQAGE